MKSLILLLLSTVLAFPQPSTTTLPVSDTLHGTVLTDPYRWLEDNDGEQTRAWIDAQVDYSKTALRAFPGREAVRTRFAQLLRTETLGAPGEHSGRYFFFRRAANEEQSVLYMRRSLHGKDELLIDPNSLSKDHTVSVNIMNISEDGRFLAYGLRQGGEDEVTVSILNVDTHQKLSETFPKALYFRMNLVSDHSGLYYSKRTAKGPRVFYHVMGTSPSDDREIFGEKYGPEYVINTSLSRDGRFLSYIVSGGGGGTEIFVEDFRAKTGIKPIVTGLRARFLPRVGGEVMFLLTNWEAPRNRLLAVNLNNPARENWREIVKENAALLQDFTLVGGRLIATYLENVQTKLEVFEPSGKTIGEVKLPSLGTVSTVSGNWTDRQAFLTFTSFAHPPTVYRYDVMSNRLDVWSKVKAAFDPSMTEVHQVWYASKDGTRIPMFLMHRRGIKLDGNRPVLLTGYGGFSVSQIPQYSPAAAIWSEFGGVLAVANIRGGGEFGERWHRAGVLEKKQNVFDDFVGAAEYLIQSGYTNPTRLAIEGTSNGGLLVGAALTQRPDLFQAVVCRSPLLDMVRYHRFKAGRLWVSEYGSSENADQFSYLLKYSPYHNVKKDTKYPAVLLVAGDSDTRVDPLHARKMTALLQSSTSSPRPILLHYDRDLGHAGGLSTDREVELDTIELSFLMWQLNVN